MFALGTPWLLRVAIASCAGWPTTLGRTIGAGPLETVITTVEPGFASVPPSGDCAITWPSGESLSCLVTVGWRLAPGIAATAADCCCPTTEGTETRFAPRETVRVTVWLREASAPPAGSVEITFPESTLDEKRRTTSKLLNPRARSCFSASATVSPASLGGMVALPRPVEYVIVTVEPSSAWVPPVGSCSSPGPILPLLGGGLGTTLNP